MSFDSILEWTEPWYWAVATIIAWLIVGVVWIAAPDLIIWPLIGAILVSIFMVIFFFIPLGQSGSAEKIDRETGKRRCRVCHNFFDELHDGVCYNCYQTIQTR
ncbi:MAG: hypothetical protein ACFFCQ_18310 [Promethearchaeota archaeon]